MTAAVSTLFDSWTGVVVPNASHLGQNRVKSSKINEFASVQQLDSSLRLGAVMRPAALAIAAVLWIPPAVLAESASARMNVSVQVLARAVVTVDNMPEIEITAADLARGYVDVAQPLQFRVRTNSRAGCLLQVARTDETFSAVELSFGNTNMTVGQESWIARPYVPGGESVTASVRVRLAPGASLGRHPLPLAFSASAL
jgi:hypothetical protein